MSRPKCFVKLRDKLCSKGKTPPTVEFKDIKKMLESIGFTVEPSPRGSHWIALHPDLHTNLQFRDGRITIPVSTGGKDNRMVKGIYLNKICNAITYLEFNKLI